MHASASDIATLWPNLSFSPTERALLVYLLGVGRRPVPAAELLREVWGYHPKTRTRTVTTTVQRLRRKIEHDPSAPKHLLFLRGRGYQLMPPTGATTAAPVATREELEHRLEEWLGGNQDWITLLTPGEQTHNLEAEPNAFVGRLDDLATLTVALDSGLRLVTVHGPPGMGKTRLALHFARRGASAYAGGAWFCDLSGARSTLDALAMVVKVLGVVSAGASPSSLFDQLASVLEARGPTLLILDNFEQLEPGAAQAAARLIGRVPELRLLVTSRERLSVPGEHVVHLDGLNSDDAVALLRVRIEAARLDRCDPLDAQQLLEVATLLEGVPLALEMAAARARILPVAELCARLRASFDVLALEGPGIPDRQRTLGQAIDWSWQLLSEREQSALIQFAVFRGGCPVHVAERVVDAGPNTLSVIGSLLDKSMLRAWRLTGNNRLGLSESVREFVEGRDDGTLDLARQRHAEWAQGWLAHWRAVESSNPSQSSALFAEVDNLVAAHAWLVARADPRAVDILDGLIGVYNRRGVPHTFLDMARITRDQLHPSGELAARVCQNLAHALQCAGDIRGASVEAESGLELAASGSNVHIRLLRTAAEIAGHRGESKLAIRLAQQAVDACVTHGVDELLCHAYGALGSAWWTTRNAHEAEAAFRQAIDVGHAAGSPQATAWSNLGAVLGSTGHLERGRECLLRAQEIATAFDDPALLASVNVNLANGYIRTGDYDQADTLYRELLQRERYQRQRTGVRGASLVNAAVCALLVGDSARARRNCQESRGQLGKTRNAVWILATAYLVHSASTLGAQEEAEQAAIQLTQTELGPPGGALAQEVGLCLGHLDCLRAARRTEQASAHIACAQERLEGMSSASEDLRMMAALLRDALRSLGCVDSSQPPLSGDV